MIYNIHYINFIMFNISTLFFSWFAQLKLGCILYAVKYGNSFLFKKIIIFIFFILFFFF